MFNQFENTVLRAYISYYGRPADAGGLAFWSEELESEGGDLDSIIQGFGSSSEYNTRFGSLGFDDLVNNLFQQLFGRNADPAGLDFYVGALESGERTLGSIALDVMYGALNEDRLVVENRLSVSQYYLDGLESGNFVTFSAEQLAAFNAEVSNTSSSLLAVCNLVSQKPIDPGDISMVVVSTSNKRHTALAGVGTESVVLTESLSPLGETSSVESVASKVEDPASKESVSVVISLDDSAAPLELLSENGSLEIVFLSDATVNLFMFDKSGNLVVSILNKPIDQASFDELLDVHNALSAQTATNSRQRSNVVPKRFSVASTHVLAAELAVGMSQWAGCMLKNGLLGQNVVNDVVGTFEKWSNGACLSTFLTQSLALLEEGTLDSIAPLELGEINCESNKCGLAVLDIANKMANEVEVPVAEILNPLSGDVFFTGETISFVGWNSPQGIFGPASDSRWNFGVTDLLDSDLWTTGNPNSNSYSAPGSYTVTYEVDIDGRTVSDTVDVAILGIGGCNSVSQVSIQADEQVETGVRVYMVAKPIITGSDCFVESYRWENISEESIDIYDATSGNLLGESDETMPLEDGSHEVHFITPSPLNGEATLTFRVSMTDSNGYKATATVTINVADECGLTVSAGGNQEVVVSQTVFLTGSIDRRGDCTAVLIEWEQLEGPQILDIKDAGSLDARFTAPGVTTLIYRLSVTDNLSVIRSDDVTITVVELVREVTIVDGSWVIQNRCTSGDLTLSTIPISLNWSPVSSFSGISGDFYGNDSSVYPDDSTLYQISVTGSYIALTGQLIYWVSSSYFEDYDMVYYQLRTDKVSTSLENPDTGWVAAGLDSWSQGSNCPLEIRLFRE